MARYLDPEDLTYPPPAPTHHEPEHEANFLSETPVKRLKVENDDRYPVHEIVDCNDLPNNPYNIQDTGFGGTRRGEKIAGNGTYRAGSKGSMVNNDPEDMLIDNSIRVDGTDHLTIAKLIQRIESTLVTAEIEHHEKVLGDKNSDKGNGTFRDWKRNFCKQ